MTRVRHGWPAVTAIFIAFLVGAPAASACSVDDTAWFESFLDTTCLQSSSQVELDALGGLRLDTTGANAATETWDTDPQFDTGITYEGTPFGPVGVNTLARSGTGAPAVLELPDAPVALVRDAANPVLGPTPSTVLDNDNVSDPAVVFTGGMFVMYYAGTAEDGSGPAIFRAVSQDGRVWKRSDEPLATPFGTVDGDSDAPVLEGTTGAFDEHGVSGPEVIPPQDGGPWKMWYSGAGAVFGEIGYATSPDGLVWTKYDDETKDPALDGDAIADPVPVLEHGLGGSADSFAASDPSVIKDGETWKMWYTGDDSNRKRIAYATSPDGIAWTKGGKVISPEDPGANENYGDGAFSPTVVKDGTTYRMYLVGRKLVSGTTYATKVMRATSEDGITWTAPSPAVNPQNGDFDETNQNSPEYVQGPSDHKLYYSGTAADAAGNSHSRIGLAEGGSPASFTRFAGAGAFDEVLDIGTLETAFDARSASGLSVAAPAGAAPKFTGFYWGLNGTDFKPRLGQASSADGSAWTKYDSGDAGTDPDPVLSLGNNAAFDNGGQRDPSTLYDQDTGTGSDDWHLYFTGLSAAGTRSIGYASSGAEAVTLRPDPLDNWNTNKAGIDLSAAGYTGVAHPSVIRDGATYRMYYTGYSGATTAIDCATATNPQFTAGLDAEACTNLAPTAGSFDKDGVRDPLVIKVAAGDYRMTYVGTEIVQDPGTDPRVIQRIGYATSVDGVTWTKYNDPATPAAADPLFNPSQTPYSFDENGVEPAGVLIDGATVHYWYDGLDRTGRYRGGHATAPFAAGQMENAWSTYQLGDTTTPGQDWREIERFSTGTGVTLWMSFLQPYSTAGKQFWSAFFPVAVDTDNPDELKLLLTVTGVRWQARLAGPAGTPTLDKVTIDHADVQFFGTGNAVTTPIDPPGDQGITAWRTATVSSDEFPNAGGTSGTVEILPAGSDTPLASKALVVNGDTELDLSGISVADNPTLRLRVVLGSTGANSPLLRSAKVLYYTNVSQPPPPVDTDGDGVPDSADACPTVAAATANGCPAPPPPPPLDVTIAANPPLVVFGQTTTLAGKVTQAGAAVPNQAVSLFQQPFGTPAFAAIAGATTSATGDWSSVVTPQSNTTYKATVPNGSSEPTAAVQVAQKMVFRASRRGTKGSFSGTIQPAHPNREVVIQRKSGTSYVTFKKVKTSSTSSFATTAKLKACQKYTFRVITAADADHAAGQSANVLVEKHRVALKVSLRGRKATFTGSVKPLHKSGTVVIKRIVGTRASKFASAKLTRKSTFRLVKTLKKGKYVFRADMGSDRCHFAGSSARRSITVR